jgi:carboxymethylenebutenolidase
VNSPVKTTWIDIAPGFAGYLALPPAGQGPGLVLWQEIFGVNPHIRAVAEQYALDGFVVLAPDTFWRQAPRVELGYVGADREQAKALMKGYAATDALADIATCVAALRARPEVAGAKVGSIGYCLGGRLAYLSAATASVDAAVAYYGGGIQSQLDRAAAITGPVQFHYAEQDDNIPLDAVERVRAAMAGKGADVHVYPGAHHGFNCWARGSYHAPSAALAHGRSLSFLAQHLMS